MNNTFIIKYDFFDQPKIATQKDTEKTEGNFIQKNNFFKNPIEKKKPIDIKKRRLSFNTNVQK